MTQAKKTPVDQRRVNKAKEKAQKTPMNQRLALRRAHESQLCTQQACGMGRQPFTGTRADWVARDSVVAARV